MSLSMTDDTCCTCASLLSRSTIYTSDSEKPISTQPPRRLSCCNRSICAPCISKNARFSTYCPFCQISSEPSPLPQGLKDPPPYSPPDPAPVPRPAVESDSQQQHPRQPSHSDHPPAYSTLAQIHASSSSSSSVHDSDPAPDVTHHLHSTDSLAGLALAYGVPAPILRRHNNLYSDHLLSARKTVSIPGSHYKGGVSLSPHPPDGAAEAERKAKVRRFMVATKCHRYEEAELYLRQAKGELDAAVRNWREDERWEREHPFDKKAVAKSRKRGGVGGGLTGQIG